MKWILAAWTLYFTAALATIWSWAIFGMSDRFVAASQMTLAVLFLPLFTLTLMADQ